MKDENLETVRSLLRVALACLETASADYTPRPTAERDIACAAWRVADAGLLLRAVIEDADIEATGVGWSTSRGALLPRKEG